MKKCPICESSLKPETTTCQQCGWEIKYFINMSPEDEIQYKAQLEKARQAWQVRQNNEPPDLKRDAFEKKEEFKQRLEQNGPYLAGTATLFKQKYNVDNGTFPIEIKWKDWVIPLTPLNKWLYIKAERDIARKLYEGKSSLPIYIKLAVNGDKVSVKSTHLSGIGQNLSVKQSSSQQAWERKLEDNWVFEYDLKPNETKDSQYKAKQFSNFKRGLFETKTEFKQRIKSNVYIVGVATLIKDKYDIENEIFPVKIKWNQNWNINKLLNVIDNSWFINVEHKLAQSLYEKSTSHEVLVRFTVEGNIIKLISLALFGIGEFFTLRHTTDEKAWKTAQQQNTSLSYKIYLNGYHLKRYATEAQRRKKYALETEEMTRDEQAWKTAQEKNSSSSYQAYLNGNTVKMYATEARRKKEIALANEEKARDEQAWKKAQQRNTSKSYQDYLNGNTLKMYVKQARIKRDYQKELEQEQAKKNRKIFGVTFMIVAVLALIVIFPYLMITIIGSSLFSFFLVFKFLKYVDGKVKSVGEFIFLFFFFLGISIFLVKLVFSL